MTALLLPLKRQYFEQIKTGTKTEEYRLYNDYWRKRIEGKAFDHITVTLGYPKKADTKRRIVRPWRGYEIKTIQHPEFGDKPVQVFAIRV